MNKITLKGIKNLSKEQLQAIKAHDEILCNDFLVSIPNELLTYNILESVSNNYAKKIRKGVFDYALGVKGLLNIVEKYGNIYIKNFCTKGTKYKDLLNVNDRIYIAVALLDEILQDIEE